MCKCSGGENPKHEMKVKGLLSGGLGKEGSSFICRGLHFRPAAEAESGRAGGQPSPPSFHMLSGLSRSTFQRTRKVANYA